MDMIEIKGRVNTALCYAKVVEEEAIEQIRRMCDYSVTEGSRIRIMPDVHAGKGNPEWNYSAPHGAGRLMSRTKAKSSLSMEEYKETMKGVYTTSVNENTLDEAPMAYKSLEDIIDVIRESADAKRLVCGLLVWRGANSNQSF